MLLVLGILLCWFAPCSFGQPEVFTEVLALSHW